MKKKLSAIIITIFMILGSFPVFISADVSTLGEVIATNTNFPTSSDNAWAFNSYVIYLNNSTSQLIVPDWQIDLTTEVTKSGDNYTYDVGFYNMEFVMESGVLSSIVLSNAQSLYSGAVGTYAPSESTPTSSEHTLTFDFMGITTGGITAMDDSGNTINSGSNVTAGTKVTITSFVMGLKLLAYKYSCESNFDYEIENSSFIFTMPDDDVEVYAYTANLISEVNLTFTAPQDGDTTISTPTTASSEYSVSSIVATKDGSSLFDGTYEAGDEYYAMIEIKAADRRYFDNNCPVGILDEDEFDEYGTYTEVVKINGETINPYATSSELLTKTGYYGVDDPTHDRLSIFYKFKVKETEPDPGPTPGPTPDPTPSPEPKVHDSQPVPPTGVYENLINNSLLKMSSLILLVGATYIVIKKKDNK